ncbi:hypothetical protein OAV21_03990, partial [bacterium]|nr:hypothetical protein [bacterium]
DGVPDRRWRDLQGYYCFAGRPCADRHSSPRLSSSRALLEKTSVWMVQPIGGSPGIIGLKDLTDSEAAALESDGDKAKRRNNPVG